MTENQNKRKRATRQEMRERLLEKLAKLDAQIEGTYTPDQETLVSKRIRAALRKRKTLLSRAEIVIVGRASTEKSPAQNGIEEKIKNAENRLADLRETKRRADERIANLPRDIERLSGLVEMIERGEEVEMPDDLFPIPGEAERTDHEHEVAAANPESED